MQATSTEAPVHAAAISALRDRGITNPEQFLSRCSPEQILTTVEWYDQQKGRVGTGVLVAELRAGGRRPQRRDLVDRQREYADGIVVWLRRNFPEWNRDDGNRTHPAAIAAVIRLHHRHGKGNLTRAAHGGEVRAAVRRFEDRFGERVNESEEQ